ncbi:hypothetical protein PanWU01x14_238620 [Parasponia andersonii]|uniref:LRR domain containing protein n=1 Tax=Parasponia andersonii TaxID=3476 RepID=A0A2P5BHD9_PARAD|nr:hypothetical protein PanWU01x14_238620 [Parasponia andersonii]
MDQIFRPRKWRSRNRIFVRHEYKTNSRVYVFPKTTFVRSSSAKFLALQKLNLIHAYIYEKKIKDITRNCPEIYNLILLRCRGLKVLEISGLDKLEALKVKPSGGTRELEEWISMRQVFDVSLSVLL